MVRVAVSGSSRGVSRGVGEAGVQRLVLDVLKKLTARSSSSSGAKPLTQPRHGTAPKTEYLRQIAVTGADRERVDKRAGTPSRGLPTTNIRSFAKGATAEPTSASTRVSSGHPPELV